jgi:DNA-binding MarR family transcriptional regulator
MDTQTETGKAAVREELLRDFYREISRMSTWTVIFHGAVSASLGLNPTDLKCGAVLRETGPITAGELAKLTGLTTGAVTGVIDRLEKAGFVRRADDPNDRRRVVIEPLAHPTHLAALQQRLDPLAAATADMLIAHYDNEELSLILDFVRRGADLMRDQTARLRMEAKSAGVNLP